MASTTACRPSTRPSVQLLANSEIDLREAMNAASNPHDLKVMLERLGIVPTGRGFVNAFAP